MTRLIVVSLPIFNLTDHGAVGDGATDNTPHINAWLQAIANAGGVGFVPEGNFWHGTGSTGGFVLPSGISIFGAGPYQGPGDELIITGNTNTNPTILTTNSAHGLATGDMVNVYDFPPAAHTINGGWPVTYVSATEFSIPVDMTSGGIGTARAAKVGTSRINIMGITPGTRRRSTRLCRTA